MRYPQVKEVSKMGIENDAAVRERASPSPKSQFLSRSLIHEINALGSLWRVEIRNRAIIKQYSGLLFGITENRDHTIYHMINSDGQRMEVEIGLGENVTLVHWGDLIVPDRLFQFPPLNKKGELTSGRGSIGSIPRVTSEKFEELVAKYLLKMEQGK